MMPEASGKTASPLLPSNATGGDYLLDGNVILRETNINFFRLERKVPLLSLSLSRPFMANANFTFTKKVYKEKAQI